MEGARRLSKGFAARAIDADLFRLCRQQLYFCYEPRVRMEKGRNTPHPDIPRHSRNGRPHSAGAASQDVWNHLRGERRADTARGRRTSGKCKRPWFESA
jgi:hypothetical protein